MFMLFRAKHFCGGLGPSTAFAQVWVIYGYQDREENIFFVF